MKQKNFIIDDSVDIWLLLSTTIKENPLGERYFLDRQEAKEKVRRLGTAADISKPIQIEALMASLQSVLATRERGAAGVIRESACWSGLRAEREGLQWLT